jgi:hypothetical protein
MCESICNIQIENDCNMEELGRRGKRGRHRGWGGHHARVEESRPLPCNTAARTSIDLAMDELFTRDDTPTMKANKEE